MANIDFTKSTLNKSDKVIAEAIANLNNIFKFLFVETSSNDEIFTNKCIVSKIYSYDI
ncbi:Hypothetical protein BPA_0900006 [Borrelia parkeri SLO]|uniref:Uncharacterized protein n=1 Tax=Borrelia parkeri SLO TaxID=1313294 RepID=A0ABM7D5M5_BORPR|nr:hypothetical protein [Borrelia parkeri]AHH09533.1 Hypothetical protein BPA_0900006 [Borrelia parkeri SLO]